MSGVGPAETLQGLGIPVVSERKGVGQNMWVSAPAGFRAGEWFSAG